MVIGMMVGHRVLMQASPGALVAVHGSCDARCREYAWPFVGRNVRCLVACRSLSQQAAAEVLGVDSSASRAELRQAFRARARRAHPDGGGSAEAFRQLREAYALLRRTEPARVSQAPGEAADGHPRASEAEWSRWEEEVRRGRELAGEDDVIFWRPDESEAWRPGKVLAVQVVYEPSSGPHGWMYLQPLVEDVGEGVFYEDEEADMEQVEPLSPDGVNWCFASAATVLGDGRWKLGELPPLPQ